MVTFFRVLPDRYGLPALYNKLVILIVSLTLCTAQAAQAQSENVRIAVLGDSLVQGYGLPPALGFVPRLQAWLDDRQAGATVINAGVSGDTTAGGVSRIGWTLTDDVDGLIVSLGGNDVLRGIEPSVARANLALILQAAADRNVPVLLIGISAPGNYGVEYKTEFEANYPALAEEYGTLLYPDFIGSLLEMTDRTDALARFFQADGVHPNAAGVDVIVNDLGPTVMQLVALAGQ